MAPPAALRAAFGKAGERSSINVPQQRNRQCYAIRPGPATATWSVALAGSLELFAERLQLGAKGRNLELEQLHAVGQGLARRCDRSDLSLGNRIGLDIAAQQVHVARFLRSRQPRKTNHERRI